jgi:hypothetical protein
MENNPDHNPQQKRKQATPPTTDTKIKKKAHNIPTTPKTPAATKSPTTTDTDAALSVATRATEYACELVQSIADEFYTEDIIGPCLSKVARALEQVCNALKLLAKDQRPPTAKKDAATATEPSAPYPKIAPNKGNKQQQNKKRTKTKLDARTPVGNVPPQKTPSPTVEPIAPTSAECAADKEEPYTLVARPGRKPNATTTRPSRSVRPRPAAVLVKVPEGRSYADTLRQVRGTELDFEGLGTHVTSIRKTLKGDLLVELTKGSKATAATSIIRDKLAETMVGSVVTRLRHTAEVEITDLDEVTTREEVLAAILKTLNADDLPSVDEVKITGLWATRDGHQMATATVPISVSKTLTTVRVGWTQCRVRPRRPEPARCYKCHGFGHSTRQCTGPDLSTACRRCGVSGHTQANCELSDHCVACDRMKAPRVPHKPGSGACAARRSAIAAMNPSNRK